MGKKDIKNNYKIFISEDEEIRDWFKVSSNRKKVWNVELWLLEELKRICEKHNIKYYAAYGTLLWAIRHKWFIPWDDDMDIIMFREDYEKFWEIAPKELPDYIKLSKYHQWFSKLVNINTTALCYENWWDEDFVGGIRIDIFPMDNASKYMIINRIKSFILLFLCTISLTQKSNEFIDRMKTWKKFFVYLCKFMFSKVSYPKVYKLHERISKKVFFKWKNMYSAAFVSRYFPKSIYNNIQTAEYETTTVSIPSWYDEYLKTTYGNYMEPIIFEWWHDCRYSVDKSYKDIIKNFDKIKSNKENYKECKDLFVL